MSELVTTTSTTQILQHANAQFEAVDRILSPRQVFWQEILDELKEAKQWQALKVLANRCIKELPSWAYAYFILGEVEYELKDYHSALNQFLISIVLDPKYASAHNIRGLAKYELKDYTGAI